MKAMLLTQTAPIETKPLKLTDLAVPIPDKNQILIKINVCAICHTDLDEIEGRLAPPKLPIIPGHQIVGHVADKGTAVTRFNIGDRVGVTWLYSTCKTCQSCKAGNENLCENAKWTGKDANGGYAQFMTIDEDYACLIPQSFSDSHAAPLLCAGVIGYRALKLTQLTNGQTIGLFGFGASAHIVIQLIKHKLPESSVFVFTRGNHHQQLAEQLGADWVGAPQQQPPSKINCAIDFTPVGQTVLDALSNIVPGGRLIINAIRKTTPIPQIDYARYLWLEREIKSVANVTRQDALEFLSLAADAAITPQIEEFHLHQANEALILQKQSKLRAAAILKISE